MVSRFAMNLPESAQPQPWSEASCEWEILEEVSPFFSEERRLLHAGRASASHGPTAAASPGRSSCTRCSTTATCRSSRRRVRTSRCCGRRSRVPQPRPRARRRVRRLRLEPARRSTCPGADAWPLPEDAFRRAYRVARRRSGRRSRAATTRFDVYLPERSRRASTRSAIRASERLRPSGHARRADCSRWRSSCSLLLVAGGMLFNLLVGRDAGLGPRAAARGARQLLPQAVPRVRRRGGRAGAGARAGDAHLHRQPDARRHRERGDAHRRPSASRVVEDFGALERRADQRGVVDDDLIVWLSRVDRAGREHLRRRRACWRRASATCSRRACCRRARRARSIARSCSTAGRRSSAARRVGGLEYLVAAAPVHAAKAARRS